VNACISACLTRLTLPREPGEKAINGLLHVGIPSSFLADLSGSRAKSANVEPEGKLSPRRMMPDESSA
jgi:hypothetical protein